MKRLGILLVTTAAVIATVAPARAATISVQVRDFSFSPTPALATSGDTITWTWTGSAPHTVTAYSGASFDTGSHTNGFTFTQPMGAAAILYRCKLHSSLDGSQNCNGMCGRIAPPAPPAAPTIDEPADGSRLEAAPVHIAGRAGSDAAFVRVDDNGTSIGTASVSGGTWFIDVSPPDGAHDIVATALSSTGLASGSSGHVRFTLDTQPPDAATQTPQDLAVVTAPFTVSGTAHDNLNVASVTVETTLSAVIVSQTTVHPARCVGCGTTSATWSASIDVLPGIYVVRPVVSDGVGNVFKAPSIRVIVV